MNFINCQIITFQIFPPQIPHFRELQQKNSAYFAYTEPLVLYNQTIKTFTPGILCVLILYVQQAIAQMPYTGNLENLLQQHPAPDTVRGRLLTDLAVRQVYRDGASCRRHVFEAITISQKNNDQHTLARAYQVAGSLLMVQDSLAKSLQYFNLSQEVAAAANGPWSAFQQASVNGDIATLAVYHNDYSEAVDRYLQSTAYFETRNSPEDLQTLHSLYTNLYSVYDILGDTINEQKTLAKSRALAQHLNDEGLLAWDVKSDANRLIDAGDVTGARRQIDSLRVLASRNGYHHLTRQALYYAALCLRLEGRYQAAIDTMQAYLHFPQKLNESDVGAARYYLADLHISLHQLNKAATHANMLLHAATTSNDHSLQGSAHELLAKIYEQEGDYELALQHNKLQHNFLDSIDYDNQQRRIVYAAAKYETAGKQRIIDGLQAEKEVQQMTIQRKNLLNWIFGAGALAILIIAYLGYRNYRQQQKIQQQRIVDLETAQQLLAAEAVLKGEAQERSRLAKDLHDGLGGMLSGIKHTFSHMRENLIMTPANQLAFERTMDMLDTSIQELRRVAHNMMPENLVRFGLDKALRDYCSSMNQTGATELVYQSYGLETWQPGNQLSVNIYRVIQELAGNAFKHASATQIIIQLVKENNMLHVTVEDDGRGFNPQLRNSGPGMGWSNIQSRVEYMKGALELHSEPGKGTAVTIVFNLQEV